MKKLVGFCMATVMLGSSLLVGCSSDGKDTKETSEIKQGEEISNFNATGDKIVNDKVTLNIAYLKYPDGPLAFEGLQFFDNYEEKTNVHVEWDMYQKESWLEKKSLLFASNDLPDAFYGNWILETNDTTKYGSQGYLIPLEELNDKYGVNFTQAINRNEDFKKGIYAPDGHIYGLPSLDETTGGVNGGLFMNKVWLDKVGKDIPKTTDEFYEVLKAFKEAGDLNGNGKNDEMSFSFRYNSLIQGLYQMFGAWGLAFERDGIMLKDGEVSYAPISDNYREGLEYFNKLYSEGLLDPEGFTQDGNSYRAKFANEERIYGAGLAWSQNWLFGTNNEEETGYKTVLPLKGPNGDQSWLKRRSGIRGVGSFTITKDCEIPEVAFRWVDGMYEENTAREANYGMVGQAIEKNEDGTYKVLSAENMTNTQLAQLEAPTKSSITVKFFDWDNLMEKSPTALERLNIRKMYEPYSNVTLFPKALQTEDEMEQLSILQTDIVQYCDKMAAKFILDGVTDESWNAYVKKMNDLGVEDFVNIHKGILERYNSN